MSPTSRRSRKYVAETVKRVGHIGGFFNNAGIESTLNPTEDFGSDEFSKVVDINLSDVFYGLKHVLKIMRAQGSGSVVNTASVGGIRGVGNQSGYVAAKHGVVGLTRNSAIAPGAIMTPMVEESLKQIDPQNWEKVGESFVEPNPMKRFGKPEEVGQLVAFLLSGDAGFINAAVIPIDGGQSYKY
ncbi:SDR family oxidoreductase [Paeniglutamicibacter gangotriensis]|uniref:SDR family oxidoreductase n=1 Tax=Paeniglutamicibacter gangotriensis TaxID=254787 RepID=UPI0021CFD028|nr:SDR family oxidoreductase [Paeniglutamicibacter gangotriensis]